MSEVYINVLVTPFNQHLYPNNRLWDTVRVYQPQKVVDMRYWAQLREHLGCPYPDEP